MHLQGMMPVPLDALRPLALIYIFGMSGVLAFLWYRGKITRTIAVAVLLVSALFGFLFASVAPYLFQLLLLGNLGALLVFTTVILGLLFLLTLVFGRIFCGSLCPLGALQELASLAPLPKIRYREKKVLYAVRFVVLFIIIAAALLLSVNVLGYLGVLDLFLLTFSLGTAVMLTILIISLFFYRPFCRALCPYGAILSLGALASPFKLRRNPSCIECGKCEFACPVDEAKRGDLKGECYLCGRCTEVCPVKGTITYRLGEDAGGKMPGEPEAVGAAGGAE
jgi:ferredoxin-type protein NapH